MKAEKRTLPPLYKYTQRLKFLTSLLYSPQFYRTISDVVGDPAKLDLTLGTICYSTLFISAMLKRYPKFKVYLLKIYIGLVMQLNQLLSKLLNKTKIKPIQLPVPKIKIGDEKEELRLSKDTEKLAIVLKSISSYITDIRIFNRGFSIPSCIADILEAGSLLQEKDYLNYISTWCISLYQPFETIAFLFDHNWLFPDRESNNCLWWYAVSTRFWFFWVIAEFLQLSHRMLIIQKGKNIEKDQFIKFVEHLATLPLCVHWSLEDGWLDDLYVGLFGTIAGGLSTFDMWNNICRDIFRTNM